MRQVGGSCTAGCVCLSEELQWLRSACSRNRCRLIFDVCKAMGLRVPTMLDYNACNRQTQMAIATTETLHHDLVAQRRDIVRVLNYCSETRRAFNGSVCVMAPWDGVWIFHGCMRGVDQCSDFGAASGDDHLLMPTASPQVKDRSMFLRTPLTFSVADPGQCRPLQIWATEPRPSHVVLVNKVAPIESDGLVNTDGLDADVVDAFRSIMLQQACPQPFFVPDIPGAIPKQAHHHLIFDEFVLESMTKLGWPRTQGMTMLTPMACALYEHWKSQL